MLYRATLKKIIIFALCAFGLWFAIYSYYKRQSGSSEIMFKDRKEAGKKLFDRLKNYNIPDTNTVVVALPRGGVPIAYEIAQGYKVPLTTFIVRKIGAPYDPELAVGALTQTGHFIIDFNVVRSLGISKEALEAVKQKELNEAARRQKVYQPNGFPSIAGKVVIVVDDGAATGSTMLVALQALKKLKPQKLIAAIPVASAEAVSNLKEFADELVVLSVPDSFGAVGSFYSSFPQVEDEEVLSLLQ